jgi:DNA-binding HxlR family transcriptional regulator
MGRQAQSNDADSPECGLHEPEPRAWAPTTQEVLGVLGRKWLVPIVRELLGGPRRQFELRCAIAKIQPKVLRETLRRLERDGLVQRVLHDDGVGGKAVAYELTELGSSLVEPLVAIYVWGREHLDEVHATRGANT